MPKKTVSKTPVNRGRGRPKGSKNKKHHHGRTWPTKKLQFTNLSVKTKKPKALLKELGVLLKSYHVGEDVEFTVKESVISKPKIKILKKAA